MAAEKDFELLDDYLSNRLSEEDKLTFEKKLEAYPKLAQELTLQQNLIAGLRNARAAELKAMLNNIPVTSIQTGSDSILIKTGTWIVVAGLVATGVYFYFNKDEAAEPIKEPVSIESNRVEPSQPVTSKPAESESVIAAKPVPEEKPDHQESGEPTTLTTPEVKSPVLEVYDPTKDAADEATLQYEHEQLELISKAFVTSSIEVETDHSNRKYNFHYMFKEGKLILYGAFEEHLYEILEFISDEKRTVVLFHKTNYYLLDIDKSAPTPLTPIRDQALLKKLKEYRGN